MIIIIWLTDKKIFALLPRTRAMTYCMHLKQLRKGHCGKMPFMQTSFTSKHTLMN